MKIYTSKTAKYRIKKITFANGNNQYEVQRKEIDFSLLFISVAVLFLVTTGFILIKQFIVTFFCWRTKAEKLTTEEEALTWINKMIEFDNRTYNEEQEQQKAKKVIKKEYV